MTKLTDAELAEIKEQYADDPTCPVEPDDYKKLLDHIAALIVDLCAARDLAAAWAAQAQTGLKEIAALTKERDEINHTCRGFEADAISREIDILNLKTELAAQLRQGADAVRMAEAGKVLRSEVERWSAILDNDVMRKATDAYDAAITDSKQEV